MERRIWIIGGANMDIVGHAHHTLKDHDSNIGTINIQAGGVGRNIAEICGRLGEKVSLLTCFGCDEYGKYIRKHCESMGIDTGFSIDSESKNTSIYLAILDENRDMRIGMNDMSILDEISKEAIIPALQEMKADDILVIDSNLDSDLIAFIANNATAIIASDPVSAAKIKRLEKVLDRISIFKPNAIEAKELTGIEIIDDPSARESLDWFLRRGIKEIIITLGERGILLGSEDEKLWITHKIVEMNSANGGGDALMGAYLSRRLRGETPRNAIEFAIAAAILKIIGELQGNEDEVTRGADGREMENPKMDSDETSGKVKCRRDLENRIIEKINTLEIKERIL